MEGIYFEITVIICLASALSILFRFLKQPAILAYILTGILINYFHVFELNNHLTLESLGELGVTFLLFMLGLELKLRELKSIGFPAVIAGTLQMWFCFVLGFFIAYLLGYSSMAALYLGIALSFSSTILIVKNLSDRKDLNSMHGKLSIGILLMQDFFAVIAIILLSSIKPGIESTTILTNLGFIILKAVLLFTFVLFASIHIVPGIVHRIARSSESLFLFSLAWVFALTAIVTSPVIGFSIEIGGFLAGLALANTAENFQIVARMKALRDFFITIFYVMVGLSMSFAEFGKVLVPAAIFFSFVLLIKPLIISLLIGILGYAKRTSFFVGSSMGQISEFSFILLFLGQKMGYVDNSTVTMVLFVGILGFLSSTYVMKDGNKIYQRLEKFLDFIETDEAKKRSIPPSELADLKNHIVIAGGDQMGRSLLHALEENKEKVVVVDFNPDIVRRLERLHVPVIFGDIADPEIHERIQLEKAKIVISTVPDLEDNLILLKSTDHGNKKTKIVVMALENEDAKILYKAGADYVILPHLSGGRYLAKMLKNQSTESESFEWYKARDMAYIS